MLENFRLRVFREVAARSSFRQAAEALYVTQPAVTQQIKALEEELGGALFDRTGGRVQLTPMGDALLRSAEASHEVLALAEQSIAALQGQVRGGLRIAASTTIAQYVLPGVLGRFARKHPKVELEMESANTARVAEAVLGGDAAIGLVEGPVHRTELQVGEWVQDELVLIAAASHSWAGGTIALADLRRAPLLLRERGSGTREVVEQALQAAGLKPGDLNVRMALSSTEAILACVEQGVGVAFASRFALQRQLALKTLKTVQVTGLTIARSFHLVRRRRPALRGAAAEFADELTLFADEVAREQKRRK
ncbi:DNA-binding transcriptional regulator, LysR family [Bryocella elongata]|uniref:DNA-binding transcriptional regulator, LysR family n=1 Tax=Bryocella elongata TaxID=863522 RepID=A0A1H6A4Q0_9BACT|nr:LysR substrate-binding domain-containing protein [Bryocella elongata]SEG43713.1 DNA-binding transcriptional regulator, LysR family [Bryocella elongata]